MNKSMVALAAGALASLSGCTSVGPLPDSVAAQSAGNHSTAVTFYRVKAFKGSVADTLIGFDDNYFIQLAENEFVTQSLPSGIHTLSVKGRIDLPYRMNIQLVDGQTTCVKIMPNPDDIVLVNELVPSYSMQVTRCPDLSGMKELKM